MRGARSRAALLAGAVVALVCFASPAGAASGATVGEAPRPAPGAPGPAAKVPTSSRERPSASVPGRDSIPARPDYSGVWVIDMERSEFGTLPGSKPEARTDVIKHREPRIEQRVVILNGGKVDSTVYHYLTTGEPTTSEVDQREVHSVVRWDGGVLQLDSRTKFKVFEVTLSERWTLSSDRAVLTMTRRVKSFIGASDQRLVFRRKP